MNKSTYKLVPIEDHKIWIEQCEATRGLREHFGLETAIDYLISEKLLRFMRAAERDSVYAAEVPAFIAEIRQIFSTDEISALLDYLEHPRRYRDSGRYKHRVARDD